MRCIFCKQDSSQSNGVEHIIPESLGNHDHVLPAGVVCDGCNNYFAREVEKPFLESFPISHLRFEQAVANKRRRVPIIPAMLNPGGLLVGLERAPHPQRSMSILVPPEDWTEFVSMRSGRLSFPRSGDAVPPQPVLSRFLAKVGIEVMACHIWPFPAGLEYLVDEAQLDEVRNHARRGSAAVEWPVSVRRIYPADRLWGEDAHQVAHEFTILKTDWDEWFLVLAIFGLELTINLGGPEIDGYERWLVDHRGVSPLYFGENAIGESPQP